MDNNRIDEFKKLPTIKRRELRNPGLVLTPTVNTLKMEAKLDMRTGACLTKRQREIVDLVSAEIMDYTLSRAKEVKPNEWIDLAKSVTFLVVAAVKKDHAMMLLHLQAIGAFFVKHFLPDFVYETKLFTLAKTDDKVDFRIK